MPWSCSACAVELTDDVAACPTCGAVKEAWTLHAEKTRNLVVTRPRLEVLRGARFSGDPAASDVLVPAKRALALRKRVLREHASSGSSPCSGRVLVVRGGGPRRGGPVRLQVEVQPAMGEPITHEVVLDGEPLEARLLLAYGPLDEPLEGEGIQGHQTIDVSDDSAAGHAARLRVSIDGRQPVGVPILGEPAAILGARLRLLIDAPTWLTEVAGDVACRVRLVGDGGAWEVARTDGDGMLHHEVASRGRYAVEVERREGRYLASLDTGPLAARPIDVVLRTASEEVTS